MELFGIKTWHKGREPGLTKIIRVTACRRKASSRLSREDRVGGLLCRRHRAQTEGQFHSFWAGPEFGNRDGGIR